MPRVWSSLVMLQYFVVRAQVHECSYTVSPEVVPTRLRRVKQVVGPDQRARLRTAAVPGRPITKVASVPATLPGKTIPTDHGHTLVTATPVENLFPRKRVAGVPGRRRLSAPTVVAEDDADPRTAFDPRPPLHLVAFSLGAAAVAYRSPRLPLLCRAQNPTIPS